MILHSKNEKNIFIDFFFLFSIIVFAQIELRSTSTNLNFRKNPWIDNNVICVIPRLTLLTIDHSIQTSTEWIKIDFNGKIGFVYSKYLVSPEFKSAFGGNYDSSNTSGTVKYYTNSRGERVQSPTFYKTASTGATAECRDGTYSFSRIRRGTCSHHGGVKRWL